MEKESGMSLFKSVVRGDETAFRLLFETYSRRLFHVAYYYLNSRELAEEAVLDVFTVIWQKRETLSHVKEPERYLYISVKNQALHYVRRGYVQEKDSFSLYEMELIPDSDTPEKSLMDEEYQVLVQQAIDSLPPKCREVFRLVLSDKLKNREIADVLGISEKTVNIHIAKAYERIAEYVNRQYKQVKFFCFFSFNPEDHKNPRSLYRSGDFLFLHFLFFHHVEFVLVGINKLVFQKTQTLVRNDFHTH